MLNPFQSSSVTQRSSLGRLINQSTILLMVAIGSIILMLALLILFHQNANATKGYTLRNLERERSQLLLEEEVLKMQVAKAQALHELEDEPQVQAMVPIKRPRYSEGDETVADK
ncbi:MAG: hypothetical protein QF755_05435 [Candidatus Peribacteraceae bacterium]|nr:hypothetical protein [Candidatus Peribacteraceae bacterium]HCI03777.1 hypothetical protein [Candidatus Peribacteria bacterium]